MKKILAFAVLAAALLASCSQDNVIETNGDLNKEIGFRPVNQKAVKATETTTANMRNFKVFGFWNDGAVLPATPLGFKFMYDVNVSKDNGVWTYNPLRYWPAEGNVDFYAYSPAGALGVVMFAETATDPVIDYTVTPVAKNQEDLLITNKLAQVAIDTDVELVFDHALSQIVFEARNKVEELVFSVESIKITHLKDAGKIDLAKYNAAPATKWTDHAGDVEFSANINTNSINYNSDDTKWYRLTEPDGGLMVLPQTLDNGDGIDLNTNGVAPANGVPDGIPDDVATTSNTYIILKVSAKLADGGNGIQILAPTDVYITLDGKVAAFEMGKKYIFRLELDANMGGPGGPITLKPITFHVDSVTDWDGITNTLP